MRSLVFGGTGMLGSALVREARSRGWAALALSREQGDVTDAERVGYWLHAFAPEVVFNCAAFTKVDLCEDQRELAMEVNGRAVGHLARAADEHGCRLVHVSSDYVFDGRGREPYREDSPTGPRSVYGESKLAGEREALASARALVVRSSWLFGPGGPNFVTTMLRLVREGRTPLRVVDDQVGCPTYTPFLARALCDLALRGATGIVHYCNREPVSWYTFAREIVGLWDRQVEVLPVSTVEVPRPAPRPAYSALDTSRFEQITGRRAEAWGWGLAEYLSGMAH